jgi:SAM-dependent methyltransferase
MKHRHRKTTGKKSQKKEIPYTGPNLNFENSNLAVFGRHSPVRDTIRDFIRSRKNVNILYVGLGLDNHGLTLCASGPFELAAMCEGNGTDYRMTLVDVQKDNLDAARIRQVVFALNFEARYIAENLPMFEELKPETAAGRLRAWKEYLSDTRQDGFMLQDNCNVLYAGIPVTFDNKRRAGEITFIEGDIVYADLARCGPYDLVHCLNVLDYIQHEGAMMRALSNIGSNLKADGLAVADDADCPTGKWTPYARRRIRAKGDSYPLVILGEVPDTETKGIEHYYVLLGKRNGQLTGQMPVAQQLAFF